MRIVKFTACTGGTAAALAIVLGLSGLRTAVAHCDTMDGPVVSEAKTALEKGDVTPVLKWVKKEHEEEVRAIFKKALAARAKGAEAKEVADLNFFENLVRIHRAGEGAAYTGLKPAGTVEAAIAAADKAISAGSVDELAKKIADAASAGIRQRFDRVITTKKKAGESVEAGREFVKAYVEFVHYVERLHDDAATEAAHECAAHESKLAEEHRHD